MVFGIRTAAKYKDSKERYNVKHISLHTFVDAFQSAYGAVVYKTIEYEDQLLSVQLRLRWPLYSQSVFQD